MVSSRPLVRRCSAVDLFCLSRSLAFLNGVSRCFSSIRFASSFRRTRLVCPESEVDMAYDPKRSATHAGVAGGWVGRAHRWHVALRSSLRNPQEERPREGRPRAAREDRGVDNGGRANARADAADGSTDSMDADWCLRAFSLVSFLFLLFLSPAVPVMAVELPVDPAAADMAAAPPMAAAAAPPPADMAAAAREVSRTPRGGSAAV